MANYDKQQVFQTSGSYAYENWRAMLGGKQRIAVYEYPLYTDAHMLDEVVEGCGPYKFLNAVPTHDEGSLRPSVLLRIEDYVPFDINVPIEKDEERYHGGTTEDELAALASLNLGIRFKSGPMSREFESGKDPLGRPVAWEGHSAPVLVKTKNRGTLFPGAFGEHNLKDMNLLTRFHELSPSGSVVLVRAARLYQDAVWVVESEPSLAWIMLVSAVETAAGYWRKEKDSPVERMRASRPQLETILLEFGGNELVVKVAEEVADYMGATKKFVDFILSYLSAAPVRGPEEWCQHPWTEADIKKSMSRIYELRSNALHGGTPFPPRMCLPVMWRANEVFMERLPGDKSVQKKNPMFFHVFEYIARNALLKWWASMLPLPSTIPLENDLVTHFVDDDAGYFKWLIDNKSGYVVNCYRNPTSTYLILHKATCPHIQRWEGRNSTHDYGKICSNMEQKLHDWAASLGGLVTRCRTCHP